MEVGDMVVATGAAKEEGTSKRYESVEYPAVPDYDALTELVGARRTTTRRSTSGRSSPTTPLQRERRIRRRLERREPARDRDGGRRPSSRSHAAKGLRAGAICTVDGNLVAGNQKGADSDDELPEKAKDNVERASARFGSR